MRQTFTAALLLAILAAPQGMAQSSGDAAAADRSAGAISEHGGVKTGPAGDKRHHQTTESAGPATGSSGKNADNNAPLAGPKRESTDRDLKTGSGDRR
ncbi:MAG TPA: hypothetical protein VD994_22215 [Prosthecobacter sp.]|nr:hypothetical protein [Prosthecobacter sp.]